MSTKTALIFLFLWLKQRESKHAKHKFNITTGLECSIRFDFSSDRG